MGLCPTEGAILTNIYIWAGSRNLKETYLFCPSWEVKVCPTLFIFELFTSACAMEGVTCISLAGPASFSRFSDWTGTAENVSTASAPSLCFGSSKVCEDEGFVKSLTHIKDSIYEDVYSMLLRGFASTKQFLSRSPSSFHCPSLVEFT